MSNILLAWELGGGFGHLLQMGAIARRLHARGHRVSLAIRNPQDAERLALPRDIAVFQAKRTSKTSEDMIDPIASFAHILHNEGMGDSAELASLVDAWRPLLDDADLVVCDHAPTALFSARVFDIRAVTIGTGFFRPPNVAPWPRLRKIESATRRNLIRAELLLVETMNDALRKAKRPEFRTLSDLYGPDVPAVLTTFEELEHYSSRSQVAYWGNLAIDVEGVVPKWPQADGPRLFAYIKKRVDAGRILKGLRSTGLPTLVYMSGRTQKHRDAFESDRLRFADDIVDMRAAARSCDVGICHAGHATICDFLFAETPMILLPIYLEQGVVAECAQRCGFGISIPQEKIDALPAAIDYVLKHDRFRENCRRFRQRYVEHDPERQLERVVDYFESLAESKSASYFHYDFDQGEPQLIFAVGAGRFGTGPMSDLLLKQSGTVVLNEACPPRADETFDEHIRRLRGLSNRWPGLQRFGDAGLYCLDRIPELIQRFPNAKIIGLRRGEEETPESFLEWLDSARPDRLPSAWRRELTGVDASLPPENQILAIDEFWNSYNEILDNLAARFPDNIRLMEPSTSANSLSILSQLLPWLGISENASLS